MPLPSSSASNFFGQYYYTKVELNAGQLDNLYFGEDEFLATSAGAGDAGKPVKLDGSGLINVNMLPVSSIDHGTLAGLSDDDHTGYARLAGRSGGQTLYGGTAANDDIIIHGTSNATRTTSYVILQPTAGKVGIGNSTPSEELDVTGDIRASGSIYVDGPTDSGTDGIRLTASSGNGYIDVKGAGSLLFRIDNSTGSTAVMAMTGGDLNVDGAITQNSVPVVTTTGTQTMTNKTLTAPVIATISNSGTITLPTGTRTLVARDTTDTLTNKTISGATMSSSMNVTGNAAFTGTSTFTGAVSDTALGVDNVRIGVISGVPRINLEDASSTQWGIDNSAGALRFLNPGSVKATLDTSGNFDAVGTITQNSVAVVTTSGTQTLTNKTLTTPVLSGTISAATITTATIATINGPTNIVEGSKIFIFDPTDSGTSNPKLTAYDSGTLGTCPLEIAASTLTLNPGTKGLIFGANTTPSSASDTGTAGTFCWDSSYIYLAVGTNTWKRAALSTW